MTEAESTESDQTPTPAPVTPPVTEQRKSSTSGAARCKAKSRRSGVQCRNPPVTGFAVCWMHGAGSRVRVGRGERKPGGRPPVTGERSDPERTRYGRLAELLEKYKADPAALRTAENELALAKACLELQYEKFLAGKWDAMKTPELMEHPESWFIERAASIVDRIVKVNSMINRDRLQALVTLVDPVITVVLNVIDQHVPEESKTLAREAVRKRLSQILVPIG